MCGTGCAQAAGREVGIVLRFRKTCARGHGADEVGWSAYTHLPLLVYNTKGSLAAWNHGHVRAPTSTQTMPPLCPGEHVNARQLITTVAFLVDHRRLRTCVQVVAPTTCLYKSVLIETETDLNKYLTDSKFMAAKEMGPCTIAYPKITAQQIDTLLFGKTKVNGGLVIENAPTLTSINLGSITTITGELEIVQLPKLEKFVAAALESVGSVLEMVAINAAKIIDLSSLVSVTRTLRINGAHGATSLDLSSLQTVGTTVYLRHVRSLKVFELPSMVTATRIELYYCVVVNTILLPGLKTVKDALVFHAIRSMTRISAPLLESVRVFSIYDAAGMKSLCEVGIKAAGIKGSIQLQLTPKLTRGDVEVMKKANVSA